MSKDATHLSDLDLQRFRASQFDAERMGLQLELLRAQFRDAKRASEAAGARHDALIKELCAKYAIPEDGALNIDDGLITRPSKPTLVTEEKAS